MCFEIEREQRDSWTYADAMSMLSRDEVAPKGLSIPVGLTTLGELKTCDLLEPAHALIAGFSGSGKSNFLITMLASLVYRYSPDDLQIDILDVKAVDFARFAEDASAYVASYCIDPELIAARLHALCEMMEERMLLLPRGVKKWQDMPKGAHAYAPMHVVLVDEVADLLGKGEVGDECRAALQRLAQRGRAAGIALVLCSQYPKANILPTEISNNLNIRIAFKLNNSSQSNVVLDESGAEDLLGCGDCLAKLDGSTVERLLVPHYDDAAEAALDDFLQAKSE